MSKAREPDTAYHAARLRPQRTLAKLFANGRSQAVRLPKSFRMQGQAVLISRDGERIILEPLAAGPFDEVAWLAKVRAIASRSRPGGSRATLADILADMRDEAR
jgi:virulence-associated protein VagC